MKIVIDIDEEIYNHMKERFMYGYANTEIDMVGLAVRNGIPFDHVFKTITDGIKEEADYAYADFERYKADILDAEADELPDDDFRYGMERAIEIINAYRKAVDE